MNAEEHLAAALRIYEEWGTRDPFLSNRLYLDHETIMEHVRAAQAELSGSQLAWTGDRDSPDALWYRHVPTRRPKEHV